MQDAGLIPVFADTLAGRLAFDRKLARSVRQEVEDHLRDTVAADPGHDGEEAERRAIARFGDARTIAAGLALAWAMGRSRRLGVAVLLAVAGIFVAMRTRLAVYGAARPTASEATAALADILLSADRCAFWLSAIFAIAASALVWRQGALPIAGLSPLGRLRALLLVEAIATGALAASVAADVILALLRLLAARWEPILLVPIASLGGEFVAAVLLVLSIVRLKRGLEATDGLLRE